MVVKALRSFSGLVSMIKGQVIDITDDYIVSDLLHAGYVEAVEAPTKEAKHESKRVNKKRSM